uniref:Uncharacterized protein n=1 Tax=Zea mays TaxID=4577 RepID=C0PMG2_MAIZE|nr:unknown [Zea mays]
MDGLPLQRAQGAHVAQPRLRDQQRLGRVHPRRVLVPHHAHHGRLRRPAPCQPRRDGVRRLLHALQPGPRRVHRRQHDQPRRERLHGPARVAGHAARGLHVRGREPVARGADGADGGDRAAQLRHDGAAAPATASVRDA